MAKEPQDTFELDVQYPLEGLEEVRSYLHQRPLTTVGVENMRSFDPTTGRARGGQRPGLARYMPTSLLGTDFSIQEINSLVTTDPVVPSTAYGQFLLTVASPATGVGSADSSGNLNVGTYGAFAGAAFACSCWDDNNLFYIAFINTSTGAFQIAGQLNSAFGGDRSWSLSVTGAATGSLRKIAGMCVIGSYLYVAVVMQAAPTNRIMKIEILTGVVIDASWRTNDAASLGANFTYSTASVNCLGKCGTNLGVECRGTGGTGAGAGFFIIDTQNQSVAGNTHVFYAEAGGNNRSKVCSDGTASFFVLASTTTKLVRKIGVNGVISWSSTVADTGVCQSICYDQSNGFLLAVCAAALSLRRISLVDGTIVGTGVSPGAITAWHNIDSDNNGSYTLWRNIVASNDIMGINSSLATRWGPSSFTNATHDGASVNPGPIATSAILSHRVTRLIAVCHGELRRFTTSGSAATTGGATFNGTSPTVFSAQNGNSLFLVDGVGYREYQASSDSIIAWTLTSGSLPVDSKARVARLIATWRGRTTVAGLPDMPQNFYMSKQYDPHDFNYSPATQTAIQAFAGNDSLAGFTGDLINGLVPYNDDTFIFLCDHTIWQLTGDPMSGGQLNRISDSIGGAWGRAFCFDPSGQLYFFGSDCAVYKMTPGALPVRASEQIPKRLQDINLATSIVRMAWDVQNRGLYVFVSPLDRTVATTHFFWEERTNSWHPIVFTNPYFNPVSVFVSDGDAPEDRVIMLGGRDGYIRTLSNDALTDDREDIPWHVIFGPFMTSKLDDIELLDFQATLGSSTGAVSWAVGMADSPEAALAKLDAAPNVVGTLGAGRNPVSVLKSAGHVGYIKLSGTDQVAFEKLLLRYEVKSFVRRRM